MTNLKNLCLLLIFSFIFTNCSSAQDKTITPPPMTQITQPSSTKYNEETKRFESTGGKFTISISQVPTETRDLGTETANKKGVDVGKMFIWQFPEKAIYTVMYKNAFDTDGNPLDFDGDPKTQSLRDLETATTYSRRGIAKSNAKIISEKSISFKDHPGTEFRYVSADGTKFIGRVFSINSIGYQIVGGYKNDVAEKEVLEVLDSFEPLPNKK